MSKPTSLIIFCLTLLNIGVFHAECLGDVRVNLSAPKELDETGVTKSQASVINNAQHDTIQRPQIIYKVQSLRDPFEPLVREEKKEAKVTAKSEVKPMPSLTVQGMIWGGSLPQAIINNKIVKVGDTLDGVKIKEIDKQGVTVVFANKEHLLSTSAAVEKKETNNEQ